MICTAVCISLCIILAISGWCDINFPYKLFAHVRIGLSCWKKNCPVLQQKQQNKHSKIISYECFTNTQKDLFILCAIRFVFCLFTRVFWSRKKNETHKSSRRLQAEMLPSSREKGLLHCEREPPVVFQLAFSGQLKAKTTLLLFSWCCDLTAKWIFSTKHNFLPWFHLSLNGKPP